MLTINREEVGLAVFSARLRAMQDMEPIARSGGSRIALCLKDPIDVIAAILALRERGASVLLIHGDTPTDRARQLAEEAGCSAMMLQSAESLIPLHGQVAQAVEIGFKGDEPSLLQFSSGTTGNAKLIRRSWQEVEAEIDAYNAALGEAAACTPVVLASVSHSFGLICGVLAALKRGIAPVVVTHSNPKLALGIIRDTPNHLVYGVPLQHHVIASLAPEGFRFHRLMSSGAPMPQSLLGKLESMTDVAVMGQYGCSEVGCISVAQKMSSHADLGKPLGHLIVSASNNADVPTEIIAASGTAGTATGDLGYMDSSGSLIFVSRLDDVINIGGQKVFPLEVEEWIGKLPGVKETAVYRGIHPVMGECVKAIVAVEEGVTPKLIRTWCQEGLPAYKVPSEIHMAYKLPRTANGKLSRRLIQELEEKEELETYDGTS
ncbi:AMP-binding protein [Paenibacillus oenotherae]|uniref:AMP-binding protein n=1 Tax=Paenibacillus oenotherae TaxID=1435645 RepID=A0ABS7D4Q2_9BACL|nr:AMP-binding protein [Paenibacillus oenotherae]MBW7474899.1 AMP-binding protein [Paenibacillus oenotherae]